MFVIERFHNGAGKITGVIAEVEGCRFLFTNYEHHRGEIRIWPWAPDFDGPSWENPAWNKLKELIKDGQVEEVYEGLSAAPDDRYVWRGEPIPELGNGGGK